MSAGECGYVTDTGLAGVKTQEGTGGQKLNGRDAARERRSYPLAGTGAAGLSLALAVTACSGAASGMMARSKPIAADRPVITIAPANGARDIQPGTPVTVTSADGKIRTVVVRVNGGKAGPGTIAGAVSGTGTVWRSAQPLAPSHRYTVTATAVGTGGKTVTASSSFRTLTPRHTFHVKITEIPGGTYGVGMPVILNFSRPVTRRAAVERALQLKTSKPVVGAWYWDGNQTLYFRPRDYWPQHTTVTFTGNFAGVEAARGVYGIRNLRDTFKIGRSLIVVASTRTHYMHVYYKGKLFGDWPISTGRPGDDTPDGTYLTVFKNNPQWMSGPGYALWVPWAVDFTASGDFIHDAYWSVPEQGYVNVSHGCVNTSPAHAETYYKMEVPGDPVTITGSPRPGTWDNGWTVWFLSWKQLLRGSALHQAVMAGPAGSKLVSPNAVPADQATAPLGRPRAHNAA
jgi:lipoprotein-anchoring transpeptidase ErfK/SrfK